MVSLISKIWFIIILKKVDILDLIFISCVNIYYVYFRKKTELILSCVMCYYCIVNNRGIVAFMNSSLYSCETYKQVKEMVILHLFIEHHYKYIVSIIRERYVLTLHLSTAN